MSYQDDRLNQIEAEIQHLTNLKRQLRSREKSIRAREEYVREPSQYQYNNLKELRGALQSSLQPQLMPGNVGGINEVSWPFFFQVEIDFNNDPTFADNVFARNSFQVDQEAALILWSIERSHSTDANGFSATINAPLQVEFIDRQSSRRFNNAPIPLQSIGSNSNPTIFPTAYYLQPNAFLDVVVSGINPVSQPQTFTGSGRIQFSFFGNRVRIDDAGKVLSNVYGQY